MVYMSDCPYRKNELYHHGIKGQRWGVRRFQNEDGTLTEAGKRRYGTVENYNNKLAYDKAARDFLNKSHNYESTNISSPNIRRVQKEYNEALRQFEKATNAYRNTMKRDTGRDLKDPAKKIAAMRAGDTAKYAAKVLIPTIGAVGLLYALTRDGSSAAQLGNEAVGNFSNEFGGEKLSNLANRGYDYFRNARL